MTAGRPVSRRQVLAGGLAAAGLALAGTGCAPRESRFTAVGTRPLPIPPLDEGALADGTRRFSLQAQTGTSRLVTGRADVVTATMGYNGALLGPTLRARRGEHIRVDIHNGLDELTTVHWHGMHLPAAMDGGPHTTIAPGQRFRAEWDLDQPAATLWYHPHPHGETERQVLLGLAGLFIIDDDAAQGTGLPDEYGVNDLPLVLQDRFLDAEGEVRTDTGDGALGTVGNTLTANGVSGAHAEVRDDLVRLRLLNGCGGRFLDLRFDDDRAFTLIGTDGGLLAEPVELTRLPMTPGERAEVLVRFRPGETVRLRTETPVLDGVRSALLSEVEPGDYVEFRAVRRLRPAAAWSPPADGREPLDVAEAVQKRTMELSLPMINGRLMDMDRIDAVVRVDTAELWEVTNTDVFPHNFHVHDVQFRVLDVDGETPPPWLGGWKDTIPTLPGQLTRLLMRFEHYADDRVPYMMHCHLLRHEDQGMMGQFLVTQDGGIGSWSGGSAGHGAHGGH